MSVKVKDLLKMSRLSQEYGDKVLLEKEIKTSDISRPGLEMTGYFDFYTPERIQLIGMKEWSYLMKMSSHNRHQVLLKMFQPETPVVIIARNLEIPKEMIDAADEKQVAILRSKASTSRLSGEISSYLDSRLAERTSVHGVLMDIYAKDEVTLWGEPAEILRHLLEIRGVGIIDVMSLYGASAVKDSSQVQIAVYLENYDTQKTFDRLGNDTEELEVAGVRIPRIRIPVKTGRNISVVIEAAAMNYRAKQMGYDATKIFEERLTDLISRNEVKHD